MLQNTTWCDTINMRGSATSGIAPVLECKGEIPDSIVMNRSNVCYKYLHTLLWLSLRLVSHEPVLLIACDDIDDNATGLAYSSLQHKRALRLCTDY